MKKIAILSFIILFFISFCYSQSLVDIAKKERERRIKIKKKVQVITNQNLRNIKIQKSTGYIITKGGVKPHYNPSDYNKTQENSEEQKNSYRQWRTEYLNFIEKITKLNRKISKKQKEYDSLNLRFKTTYNVNDKLSLPAKIRKVKKEIDQLRKELKNLKEQLEDFKEKARRAGVPPGYLR